MARRSRNGRKLSQVYLLNQGLVRQLVSRAGIRPTDLVYEIGPGGGIITAELARRARRVIAIEVDPALARPLLQRFAGVPNVEIVQADFLGYQLQGNGYTIFGNIPFSRTAEIVRKILCLVPGPRVAGLIMQEEAAMRFAGHPHETQFSILAKADHELRLVQRLPRTEFRPSPRVDAAMLLITRRALPLFERKHSALFRQFVRQGFGGHRRILRLALQGYFSYPRWKHLARALGFPRNAVPSQLRFEQWLGLFKAFTGPAG